MSERPKFATAIGVGGALGVTVVLLGSHQQAPETPGQLQEQQVEAHRTAELDDAAALLVRRGQHAQSVAYVFRSGVRLYNTPDLDNPSTDQVGKGLAVVLPVSANVEGQSWYSCAFPSAEGSPEFTKIDSASKRDVADRSIWFRASDVTHATEVFTLSGLPVDSLPANPTVQPGPAIGQGGIELVTETMPGQKSLLAAQCFEDTTGGDIQSFLAPQLQAEGFERVK